MPDSMIERAARAAENAVLDPALGVSIEIRGEAAKLYRAIALSVISAMREPSAYMIEAGEQEYDIIDDGIAQPLFSTMIDAALAEEG